MPARCIINALVIVASLANAVPSRAEFHPIVFRHDPMEDELMGSGFEIEAEPSVRGSKREAPVRKIAQTWRKLAGQMRWLASFLDGRESDELLARAADYEARAKQLESSRDRNA